MRKFIAFISYRHLDLDISVAKKLHRLIEHFRIPAEYSQSYPNRKFGYVFRDQDELPVSSDLSESIQNALDNSEFLIVICTPETPKSVWVEREISYFLRHHDRDHILAVLADGTPSESFPDQLVTIRDENGRITDITEPLAANIVGKSKSQVLRKLNNESLRLFAALLGCSYDSLYQREKRYQFRRIAAITSAGMSVAIAFIFLLLSKNREITLQNQQLIYQRQAIQRNESQLLIEDAQDALDEGNYSAVLRQTIAALPTDEADDRPYVTSAESLLMKGVGLFDPDYVSRTYFDELKVELSAPIRMIDIDDERRLLVALDCYGGLVCVDPYTGSINWERYVAAEDAPSDPVSVSEPFSHMKICKKDSTVIAVHDHVVGCYSVSDGHEIWHRVLIDTAEPLFCMSENEDYVAIMARANYTTLASSDFNQGFDLVVLRTADGEVFQRIPVAREKDYFGLRLRRTASTDIELQNGFFFNDDQAFIGYYYNDSDSSVTYYYADFRSGENRTICTEPFSSMIAALPKGENESALTDEDDTPIIYIDVSPSSETLFVVKRGSGQRIAASIEGIDIESGNVVWSKETPYEEDASFFSYLSTCCILRGTDAIWFGIDNKLYAIDMTTGEILASASLYDAVTSMSWVEEGVFSCILKNGYYALGWMNASGSVDSWPFDHRFDVGSNAVSLPGQNGFLSPIIEDGALIDFSINNDTNHYGFVATIPEDSGRTLMIRHILPSVTSREERVFSFPDDNCILASEDSFTAVQVFGDHALMTEIQMSTNDFISKIVDLNSLEVKAAHSFPGDVSGGVLLLPDGSGLVILNQQNGTITHYRFGNRQYSAWYATHDVELARSTTDDNSVHIIVGSDALFSAEYRFDGHLVTAVCDNQRIEWWVDDIKQPAIELPSTMVWQISQSYKYSRLLRVGKNGCILLSDFGTDVTGNKISRFVCYDTVNSRWLGVDDRMNDSPDRLISVGSQRPLLGVYENTGVLNIYDMESEKSPVSIPIGFPKGYIFELQFILDDQYIVLRTEDGQLFVYSTETAACVYRGEFKPRRTSQTKVSMDHLGKRILLMDLSTNEAILFDGSSWNELARINNVYGYNANTDEICLFSASKGMVIRKVLGLWDLIDIANASLGR